MKAIVTVMLKNGVLDPLSAERRFKLYKPSSDAAVGKHAKPGRVLVGYATTPPFIMWSTVFCGSNGAPQA